MRSDLFFFFFNDTATTEIYTLSLHDALPIFAFRREAEVFFDEEELVGSASAALDELVHAVPRGVHQRRRRAVNQIAGGEQIPTRRRELLPIEDPEDRPEDVVAPHVRRAVQWIEDDPETSAAEILHLSHFLRGDLGDEL